MFHVHRVDAAAFTATVCNSTCMDLLCCMGLAMPSTAAHSIVITGLQVVANLQNIVNGSDLVNIYTCR
jgi:hypothetical protein